MPKGKREIEKRPTGRPRTHPMPDPIPDDPENVARILMTTKPKKNNEWEYLEKRVGSSDPKEKPKGTKE